jgi:hypothetical protein
VGIRRDRDIGNIGGDERHREEDDGTKKSKINIMPWWSRRDSLGASIDGDEKHYWASVSFL